MIDKPRQHLDELAQRMAPAATWENLALPQSQLRIVRAVAAHFQEGNMPGQAVAIAGRGSRRQGLSVLFTGPSATGKTMATEVLANELKLDLYRVDLNQIVSKYIGETEKNLRRLFDAAEGGSVILFFDEADALFGKRTEVKNSHDRYLNTEIECLLQRIEAGRSLAVLSTATKRDFPVAWLPRIRFAVHFS
jgi:SpoVK/Ycf46/Vps4 family AAA+-type ATPase